MAGPPCPETWKEKFVACVRMKCYKRIGRIDGGVKITNITVDPTFQVCIVSFRGDGADPFYSAFEYEKWRPYQDNQSPKQAGNAAASQFQRDYAIHRHTYRRRHGLE